MSSGDTIDAEEAVQLLDVAEQCLRTAVPQFLEGLQSDPGWKEKSERDPVSEIDIAIEQSIRESLDLATPKVGFVGEETGGTVPVRGRAWALDPIDGTVNYLQGSPLCAISLGLFIDGKPELGVVIAPALDLVYRGASGVGATCNGRSISPSHPASITSCVVSVGDYATGEGAKAKNADRFAVHQWLATNAYRVRMLGSAALDLVWVADGRLGATVILSNRPWDMAAGTAIARAAGAIVAGRDGEAHNSTSAATLASGSQAVLDAVVERLRSPDSTL